MRDDRVKRKMTRKIWKPANLPFHVNCRASDVSTCLIESYLRETFLKPRGPANPNPQGESWLRERGPHFVNECPVDDPLLTRIRRAKVLIGWEPVEARGWR